MIILERFATTTLLDAIVSADQLQAAGVAAMELGGYVLEHFEQAAVSPAGNLLSGLAGRCAGGELDQVTALGMMLTLFSAGGESTASLLGSATWLLAAPDVQRQVRDSPELLRPFIEESLRCEPPFRGHYRHVRHDTTFGGVELPADSHLLLMWVAANRDPGHFEQPDEFQLDRPTGKGHIVSARVPTSALGRAGSSGSPHRAEDATRTDQLDRGH